MNEENSKKMFYRLRSLKSIFEYKELENQEIYFASLDELNDPMEGFRNVVFKGDKKDWEILFINYLQSFDWAYARLSESGGKYDIFSNLHDMVNYVKRGCFADHFGSVFQEFKNTFGRAIKRIATRTTPINKDELLFYLEHINLIVLELMHKYYNPLNKNHRLCNSFDNIINKIIKKIDEIEECIKGGTSYQECLEQILDKAKIETQPMHLILKKLNTTEISENNISFFSTLDFPNFYLQTLETLFIQYHVACFMEEVSNSAVWGHYGNGHKGICLMFGTINQSLALEGKGKPQKVEFQAVHYNANYDEINLMEIFNNSNPEDLRKKAHDQLFIKTKDWSYEKEYRIVAHLSDNINPAKISKEDRKLKYRFEDLHGIIFGIKTPKKDKIKIINILKEKCIKHKRNSFKIYQAYYSQKRKDIQHFHLMDLDDTPRKKIQ